LKKLLLSLVVVSLLSGCGITKITGQIDDPVAWSNGLTGQRLKEFNELTAPAGPPMTVAVYSFVDKTGQRKPNDKIAQISTAVTQGSDVWVIDALKRVGGGQWFKVIERGNLDALTKERQLIRQTREQYQGKDAKPLKPLLFAGLIVDGGIIAYDSNIVSGGVGVRVLGIGPNTQYRQDQVTVALRVVSVNTGEVLVTVSTTKTILSVATSVGAFMFYDMGTKSFEAETGSAANEPVSFAVRAAIEQTVVEMIKQGAANGVWDFKPNPPAKW
jgi:curli production assembly/transport component CsgG